MLEQEVKLMLIDVARLEDIAPGDIDPDAPLFGDGLGLDSLDVLELSLALQQRYGITLPAHDGGTRAEFVSVRTVAALIESHRT
jgi:acyl carrier protein